MPTADSRLIRAGFACDASSGVGIAAAIVALCLGRMIQGAFGTAAAGLAWTFAFFGAAAGLSLLRKRIPQMRRPLRTAALSLVVAGVLLATAPYWVRAVEALREAIGWAGYPAALLYALPLGVIAAALAMTPVLFVRWQDGAGKTRTTGSLLIGAVGGTALVLWLWPTWGSATLLWIGGGLLVLIALFLLIFDAEGEASPHPVGPAVDATTWILLPAALAVAVTLRGWNRLLDAMLGAHLLTAGVLIGALLLCMAIGVIGIGWFARRTENRHALLGALLSLSAVATALSAPTLRGLPDTLVANGMNGYDAAWGILLGTGPAALLWGGCLAAASEPKHGTAAWTARLLPLLVGGGIGALVGTRWFALDHVLAGAGVLALLAAASGFAHNDARRPWRALLFGLPVLLLAVPGVNEPLRANDWMPATVASRATRPVGLELTSQEDVDTYTEWFGARPPATSVAVPHRGRHATAWLLQHEAETYRLSSGWVRADNAAVPGTAAGLLGVLLRPRAATALVAEVDPPTALRALANSSVKRLVAVRANGVLHEGTHFAPPAPREALSQAHITWKTGTVLDHLTPDTYDIVVAATGPLWRPDIAMQATTEGWERGRAALRAGGVFIQPLHTNESAFLARVMATFRAVFPTMWLFRFDTDFVMVGFESPPVVDHAHWTKVLDPARNPTAERGGFDRPGALWKHFAADGASLDAALKDVAPIHADEPAAELGSAAARWGWTGAPNLAFLKDTFPPDFTGFERALLAPWMDDALRGWIDAGRAGIAHRWEQAWPYGSRTETLDARARIALERKDYKTAGTMAGVLMAKQPDNLDGLRIEVRALVEASRAMPESRPAARRKLEQLAGRFTGDGRALAVIASGMDGVGNPAGAQTLFERALKIRGKRAAPSGTKTALGRLLLTGVPDAAREAEAVRLLRTDPATYEDVEALDLLARTLSMVGDEEADAVEHALSGLSRTRGREHLRRARRHLVHGAWPDAAEAAHAATDVWPSSLDAWLVRAFAVEAQLAERAARNATASGLLEARSAIRKQVKSRSEEGGASERKARRVLGWFGGATEPAGTTAR